VTLELQSNPGDIVAIPVHPHGSVPPSVPFPLFHPVSEVGTRGHLRKRTTLLGLSDRGTGYLSPSTAYPVWVPSNAACDNTRLGRLRAGLWNQQTLWWWRELPTTLAGPSDVVAKDSCRVATDRWDEVCGTPNPGSLMARAGVSDHPAGSGS
jgi:hypothetical protein